MRTFHEETFSGESALSKTGMNRHAHPQKPPRIIVFVHGLFGEAYDTWAAMPGTAFENTDLPADVAIFGYPTGFNKGARKKGLVITIDQLLYELELLAGEYETVIVAAHSLGGLVAGDVPARFAALGALAGLPSPAVTSLVASAIDVVIHLRRGRDGRRVVAELGVLRRAGEELAVHPVWTSCGGEQAGWPRLRSLLDTRAAGG